MMLDSMESLSCNAINSFRLRSYAAGAEEEQRCRLELDSNIADVHSDWIVSLRGTKPLQPAVVGAQCLYPDAMCLRVWLSIIAHQLCCHLLPQIAALFRQRRLPGAYCRQNRHIMFSWLACAASTMLRPH